MCGTKRLNPFFRLHEASEVLNKYVMRVWSDNLTAAFFVSFIVVVFVRAHPVRGESHIQRNANREVATIVACSRRIIARTKFTC